MKRVILLPLVVLTLVSPYVAADYNTKPDAPASSNMNAPNTINENSDAIGIIMQDHVRIGQMLDALDKKLYSNMAESRTLFKELKDFLVKHETMEQTVWYPELEKQATLKTIIADLKQEEDNASKALKEIDGLSNDNEWVSKVKSLKTAVEQHAQDEETKLFPKVKELLDASQLNAIGKKLMDYRSQNGM